MDFNFFYIKHFQVLIGVEQYALFSDFLWFAHFKSCVWVINLHLLGYLQNMAKIHPGPLHGVHNHQNPFFFKQHSASFR